MRNLESIHPKTLEIFIHSQNSSHAIIKDAKSGKCLDINKAHLEVYGLSKSQDMIGNTVWDVNNFMSKMWLDNALQVQKFDEEVIYKQTPLIIPLRVWLTSSGFVWAHSMAKYPIMNANDKVIAILGTSEDRTNELGLEVLFGYYCHFYKQSKKAISMFLCHIQILQYFDALPTISETKILIGKKRFIHNKLIAEKLRITEGSVETYVNRLTSKLNNTICTLKEVINRIKD